MHLRPVTIEDFNMVIEWAQDPNLDEYFRRTPPLCDWAEPSKFMQQMGDKYIVMKNGSAIGLLSMGIEDHLSRTAKWGVLLAKKDRGDSTKVNEVVKSILFDKLGCNKIFCIILSHRDGLKQNLEAAGYEHEGTLKKSCLYRGKLVDECLYSLLRREYWAADATILSNYQLSDSASVSLSGDTETRPANIALNYIIKY